MIFLKKMINWIIAGFFVVLGFLMKMFIVGYIIFLLIDSDLKKQCERKWSFSGFESQYSHSTGCLIEVNNHWIPAENYREILTKE